MTRVLIIGHSDADGHLIAEQTRRNLSLVPTLNVEVLVDPHRTQGHQVWRQLELMPEIDGADLVFFVDLMFSPSSFVAESEALVAFAQERQESRFFIVDHHPLPIARLAEAKNIRAVYRPDVFECVFGPRSGMMVLAAICEHQRPLVESIRQPYHDILAQGLRRAAAPGGELGGEALLGLLRHDRWDAIYAIGADDVSYHRLVRGRRVSNQPRSKVLVTVERLARSIPHSLSSQNQNKSEPTGRNTRSTAMPYDVGVERFVKDSHDTATYRNAPVLTQDLEALVTLLEVAALSLTDSPETAFTVERLLEEARDLGGEGIEIDERAAKIILQKASFLEMHSGKMRLR
ncbi:hypothetical protein [Parvibaculum sp.]|uniref:hypothetical protein n=1 Tax=Parvibaculum sp. TaxID=2024848 RepID=UPI002CD716EE|nr:hypothetical protein [Parvibaculum sp.]HUD50757.1 hypothetical protein [Parvibaculum sp.]